MFYDLELKLKEIVYTKKTKTEQQIINFILERQVFMAVGITKIQYFLVKELPSPLQDLKIEARYPQAPFPLNFRQLGGSSQVLTGSREEGNYTSVSS